MGLPDHWCTPVKVVDHEELVECGDEVSMEYDEQKQDEPSSSAQHDAGPIVDFDYAEDEKPIVSVAQDLSHPAQMEIVEFFDDQPSTSPRPAEYYDFSDDDKPIKAQRRVHFADEQDFFDSSEDDKPRTSKAHRRVHFADEQDFYDSSEDEEPCTSSTKITSRRAPKTNSPPPLKKRKLSESSDDDSDGNMTLSSGIPKKKQWKRGGNGRKRGKSVKMEEEKSSLFLVPKLKLSHKEAIECAKRWYAITGIRCIYQRMDKDGISAEAIQVLDKISKEVENQNCHAYPISLDDPMPMLDDYRGLSAKLDELLLSDPSPVPPDPIPIPATDSDSEDSDSDKPRRYPRRIRKTISENPKKFVGKRSKNGRKPTKKRSDQEESSSSRRSARTKKQTVFIQIGGSQRNGANSKMAQNESNQGEKMDPEGPDGVEDPEKPKEESGGPEPINFTGAIYMNPFRSSSRQILKNSEKAGLKKNQIYQEIVPEFMKNFLEGTSEIVEEEQKFFDVRRPKFVQKSPEYLPIPIYKVNSSDDFGKLERILEKSTICIIRGIEEAIGLDRKVFSLNEITATNPDFPVDVIRLLPQPATWNFWYENKLTCEEKSTQWRQFQIRHTIELAEFKEYYEATEQLTHDAVKRILQKPDQYEEFIKHLEDELHKKTIPVINSKTQQPFKLHATLNLFGSNLDLDDETIWAEQAKNTSLYPDFLAPNGHGRLLEISGERIRGMNTVQMYLKTPGSRTHPHLENNALASVNVNLGPDAVVWLSIPLEFSGKFQKLLRKKMMNKLVKIHTIEYWPSEQDLINEGIPIQKFLQKAGDLVYIGIGTYHWVASDGYSVAISWNVAQRNYEQLAMAAAINDHYLAARSCSLCPLETSLWNMARVGVPLELKSRKLMKTMLFRSLSHCQSELNWIKHWKMPLGTSDDHRMDVKAVERCSKCEQCVFNFIPIINKIVRCLKCLSAIKRDNVIVVQRYPMLELGDLYDAFHVDPAI